MTTFAHAREPVVYSIAEAIEAAWHGREVTLSCATDEDVQRSKRLLRDRLGSQADLVRVVLGSEGP